jgi:galactitol 1-phosphate 5-dehydrogenase (EC 1.1.1.251)
MGNRRASADREKLKLEPLIAHVGNSESFAQAVQALNGSPMQGKIMLRLA